MHKPKIVESISLAVWFGQLPHMAVTIGFEEIWWRSTLCLWNEMSTTDVLENGLDWKNNQWMCVTKSWYQQRTSWDGQRAKT